MRSKTFLYITSPRNAWISSYKFMKSWHFHLTLREIFSSFGQVFVPTSWPIFSKCQFNLTKVVNMKFLEGVSSFRKHPRAWIYHIWARRYKDLKLNIHSWITSHFCWRTQNSIRMMCCIISLCRSCGLLLILRDFYVIFGTDFKLWKKRVVEKVKLYANGNVAFAFLTINGIKTWTKLQMLV